MYIGNKLPKIMNTIPKINHSLIQLLTKVVKTQYCTIVEISFLYIY